MVQAAFLSRQEGYCSDNDLQRIRLLLQRLKLPVDVPVVSRDDLINALAKDKKNRSGTLQYICNRSIGFYAIHQFTPAQLAEACCTGR